MAGFKARFKLSKWFPVLICKSPLSVTRDKWWIAQFWSQDCQVLLIITPDGVEISVVLPFEVIPSILGRRTLQPASTYEKNFG